MVTYRVKAADGRSIAAYKFGTPVFVDDKVSKVAGRTALSKALKRLCWKIWCNMFCVFATNGETIVTS